MAKSGYTFVRNNAGIRKLLQSDTCLSVMERYAQKVSDGGEIKPFIGFDRAKCFVDQRSQKK